MVFIQVRTALIKGTKSRRDVESRGEDESARGEGERERSFGFTTKRSQAGVSLIPRDKESGKFKVKRKSFLGLLSICLCLFNFVCK